MDDYFKLLDMPKGLELDENKLTANYLALQQKFHPDRFVGKPEPEKKEAAIRSANINEAYAVLKDKFKRIEYLLKICGVTELKADNAMLMEIMELREQEVNERLIRNIEGEIKTLFDTADDDYKRGSIAEVERKFLRIKYLKKFLEDVAANS